MSIAPIFEWCVDKRHTIFLSGLSVFLLLPEITKTFFGVESPFPLTVLFIIVPGALVIRASGSRNKYKYAFALALIILMGLWAIYRNTSSLELTSFGLLFIYFCIVSYFLYRDVLSAGSVSKSVVIGAFTGYLMIGILFFFIFTILDIHFHATLSTETHLGDQYHNIFYFSFVTLTTIGYGDILPISALGQKLAVIEAIIGQFYIAAVMAVIVAKFINQNSKQS